MKKKSILLIVLFAITKNLQSQVLPKPAKKVATFSFATLTGGTVIIKAQLDDYADTLNFILDTGSGGISLDSTTAAYYKLLPYKSNKIVKGIAGTKTLDFLYDHSLKIKKFVVEHLDFHINNYEVISSAYGVKIDGVMGLSFLRRFILKINYDINIIEVYEPGSITYPKRGILLKPQFLSLPIIGGFVSDNTTTEADLIFDTGAGLNLLLSNNYIKDSNVLQPGSKVFTTQAEGLGGKKTIKATVLSKFNLGKYKFKLVPAYIFDDEFGVLNYPQSMGVVGNDVLRRFNAILNYPAKEIHLKPNTHFYDEFDYSYSGLGMYVSNGKIKVEEVVENSPADKAGLQVDDIIISIDNLINNNIQAYKQALQNVGATLKIAYLRNGNIESTTLVVGNILRD